LGQRGPGNLIGEISLLSDAARSASALALEPSILLAITRDDFWRMMKEEAFQQTVMHTLIEHIRTADQSRVSAAVAERELLDRISSLASERERLAEIMQLRQETIRFIVHDLRNPLNLTRMALSMVEMTGDVKPDDPQVRFMAMAKGGLQRMLSLVDVILDVERLEGGQAPLELDLVDLAALIEEVVTRIQPMAGACKVELEITAPIENLPPVVVDRLRIDRVLTNLIDNAIKFMQPGGQVSVSARQSDSQILVTINDTGPGISPDQRERIFDRFVQTDTGRKASGFGLGLAYCRSALTAHGGKIWAEAGDNDIGTKFMFTLPLEPT
jgi:signal transduction histidine kinase